ncbi:unnamed protein product [Allacma fusca]|uniref:O-acyltransferase WSD1 C-terminal domain-containing protein n=1 Tax=Allacma fusca TaxID=39272 RepID=A0A8J2P5E2_9HEXA|nr:unnamed protein product [Allacma fusca]
MRLLTRTPFQFPEIKLGDTRRMPLWKKIKLCLRLPYDTAANLYMGLGAEILGGKTTDFKSEVAFSVSSSVNVEIVKRIKDHFNVAYATVLYAAMFGAIERAIEVSGQSVPHTLVSAFVLPRPNHPKGLNIHLAMIFAEWPVKSYSSVDRMLKIQKNFESLSTSTAAAMYMVVIRAASILPMRVRKFCADLFLRIFNISVGCTNFPTTIGRESYDEHEMVDIIVAMGTLYSVGLVTATGGLNNQQRFNFTVDKNLLGSEDAARKLGSFAVQELQNLFNATL